MIYIQQFLGFCLNLCDFLIFLVQGCEWRWVYGVSIVGLWCFYGVICRRWFVGRFGSKDGDGARLGEREREREREREA
jgi:hypothetical protein